MANITIKGGIKMRVTRYINGKPISETGFKSISIKSINTEKIIEEAAKRAEVFDNKDAK